MKIINEPRYKCGYCGREFYDPIPHRCNTGFRKRHQKWITINQKAMYEKEIYLSVIKLCKSNGYVSVSEVETNLLCSRSMARGVLDNMVKMNLLKEVQRRYELKGIHYTQSVDELVKVLDKKLNKK